MMFFEVIIQMGVQLNLCPENQLGKQRMREAKARKPAKATAPESHQRNW